MLHRAANSMLYPQPVLIPVQSPIECRLHNQTNNLHLYLRRLRFKSVECEVFWLSVQRPSSFLTSLALHEGCKHWHVIFSLHPRLLSPESLQASCTKVAQHPRSPRLSSASLEPRPRLGNAKRLRCRTRKTDSEHGPLVHGITSSSTRSTSSMSSTMSCHVRTPALVSDFSCCEVFEVMRILLQRHLS